MIEIVITSYSIHYTKLYEVRVLGIDPGSRITGYGVIDAYRGQCTFVTCGVIKTDSGAPFSHRINEIFDGINQIIQVHQPVVAAVEDVS